MPAPRLRQVPPATTSTPARREGRRLALAAAATLAVSLTSTALVALAPGNPNAFHEAGGMLFPTR